jgi:hypothetical protein
MRERIDVEFFDCAEPLSARKHIEELCTGPLSAALDTALSAWDSAPDEVVSIDRVELNVTGLTEQNMETELIRRIVSALNRALERQLGASRTTQSARARPISRSVLEEICFFVQRGFLPWPVSNPRQWQLQAAQILAAAPFHELSLLISLLTSGSARLRFVRHFPAVLHGRILPELWQTPDLEPLLEDAEILFLSTLAPESADLRLRDDVLAILLEHGILRRGEGQAGLEAAARVILDRVLQERPFPLLSRFAWRSRSFARVANDWIGPWEIPPVSSPSPVPQARLSPAAERESPVLRGGPASSDEPIFINNAGLVIVAPYLPTLFTKLGLEEEGRIVKPADALMLTHYLVFGAPECSEWDLVLGKILCGIPLEEAVQVSGELLPEHMAEANALLRGVIANWPALKNTSIDGLRETFLQREGILARATIGWKLRVERKAPDVLLDTLPWTISMIRLPWMECMLTTEWG